MKKSMDPILSGLKEIAEKLALDSISVICIPRKQLFLYTLERDGKQVRLCQSFTEASQHRLPIISQLQIVWKDVLDKYEKQLQAASSPGVTPIPVKTPPPVANVLTFPGSKGGPADEQPPKA